MRILCGRLKNYVGTFAILSKTLQKCIRNSVAALIFVSQKPRYKLIYFVTSVPLVNARINTKFWNYLKGNLIFSPLPSYFLQL